MSAKRFLVIGLGRFGKSVLKGIHKQGYEVVGCDQNEFALNEVEEFSSYLIEGDATDNAVLEEINVTDFDCVIVSMGDNFEAAILIVTKLKNMGCKHIISKANDTLRGQALEAVGAHRVIFPEEETGIRLAKQIVTPGIIEYIEFAPNCTGIEITVPESFIGKTLSQLDLRKKYKVSVMVITRKSEKYPIISPMPDVVFEEGDEVFVIGEDKYIERLKRKLEN